MLWIALGLLITVEAAHQYIQKYLANRLPAVSITLGAFGTAAILAVGYHLAVRKEMVFSENSLLIASVAGINALGAWFFLKAIRINLTRSVLTRPLIAVLGIVLIAIFLGEWSLLNPTTANGMLRIAGIIMAFAALTCFATSGPQTTPAGQAQADGAWAYYAGSAVVIWGVVNFLLKFFSLKAIPTDIFLASWYPAAFAATVLIRLISAWFSKQNKKAPQVIGASPLRKTTYLILPILGCTTVTTLGLTYWALSLGPGVIVLSVHDVLTVLSGVVLGLLVFGERKNFYRRDWLGALCTGGTVIIFSLAGR